MQGGIDNNILVSDPTHTVLLHLLVFFDKITHSFFTRGAFQVFISF